MLKNHFNEDEFYDFDLKVNSIDATLLLDEAKENLRCIDWQNISKDLFLVSVRDSSSTSYYSLSRKVHANEQIDYFISHSWSDDGAAKYEKLSELADLHYSKYNRYPTFWFDKVCIDQNNIGVGLKVLPINVMACRWMLILCGDTYPTRYSSISLQHTIISINFFCFHDQAMVCLGNFHIICLRKRRNRCKKTQYLPSVR